MQLVSASGVLSALLGASIVDKAYGNENPADEYSTDPDSNALFSDEDSGDEPERFSFPAYAASQYTNFPVNGGSNYQRPYYGNGFGDASFGFENFVGFGLSGFFDDFAPGVPTSYNEQPFFPPQYYGSGSGMRPDLEVGQTRLPVMAEDGAELYPGSDDGNSVPEDYPAGFSGGFPFGAPFFPAYPADSAPGAENGAPSYPGEFEDGSAAEDYYPTGFPASPPNGSPFSSGPYYGSAPEVRPDEGYLAEEGASFPDDGEDDTAGPEDYLGDYATNVPSLADVFDGSGSAYPGDSQDYPAGFPDSPPNNGAPFFPGPYYGSGPEANPEANQAGSPLSADNGSSTPGAFPAGNSNGPLSGAPFFPGSFFGTGPNSLRFGPSYFPGPFFPFNGDGQQGPSSGSDNFPAGSSPGADNESFSSGPYEGDEPAGQF